MTAGAEGGMQVFIHRQRPVLLADASSRSKLPVREIVYSGSHEKALLCMKNGG